MEQVHKYRFRVSDLCHFVLCPKRARIQCFDHPFEGTSGTPSIYQKKGIELHEKYSSPYKNFESRHLKYLLEVKYGKTLSRTIKSGNMEITVRGQFDDLFALPIYNGGKVNGYKVRVTEYKTTSKSKFFTRDYLSGDYLSATFQLELYLWILEPCMKELGYVFSGRHFVEISSQNDSKLLQRIIIQHEDNMDKRIIRIVEAFQGLRSVTYPPDQVCKMCPRSVKVLCGRWKEA